MAFHTQLPLVRDPSRSWPKADCPVEIAAMAQSAVSPLDG